MEEIRFLILTILFELPVALCFLHKENWSRVFFTVIGLNFISHPIVWELIYSYGVNWYLAELLVVIFEGILLVIFFKKRRMLAVGAGISMNVITAAIGLLLF